jgi:hypothetical protein
LMLFDKGDFFDFPIPHFLFLQFCIQVDMLFQNLFVKEKGVRIIL